MPKNNSRISDEANHFVYKYVKNSVKGYLTFDTDNLQILLNEKKKKIYIISLFLLYFTLK